MPASRTLIVAALFAFGALAAPTLSALEGSSATKAAAPDGTPATRTTIGVGEIVTLTTDRDAIWSADSGTPTEGTGTTFEWTAPNRPATCTITAVGGDSGDETLYFTFTVVAPRFPLQENLGDVNAYRAGWAGAGFESGVTIQPTSVSFDRVQVIEGRAPASAVTGFFRGIAHVHPRWADFKEINEDNALETTDKVGIAPPGYDPARKRFAFGSWLWIIPWSYRVVGEGGDGVEFARVPQLHLMLGAAGTMLVFKPAAVAVRTP